MSTSIARRLRALLRGNWTGLAALYEVEPPLSGERFVVISTTVAQVTGIETAILPATSRGEIKDWTKPISVLRGCVNHRKALAEYGYQVNEQAVSPEGAVNADQVG